jgi:uncharacterized protein YndB with AHSA1/START domain
MGKQILQKWFFDQPAQIVWEYLTKPDLIEQWLTKTDFQPIIGHSFHFIDKTGKIISCKVLEVTPYHKLSYSWQFHSAKDKKPYDSTVVWTLTPKRKGTELQLSHHGFLALEDYEAHSKGWNICIERFEKLIQKHNYANPNT